MGKKGGWFSAIKRVFTYSSKDKTSIGSSSDYHDHKGSKERIIRNKGKGILNHAETKSFIPSLFRDQPSSIETILREADQLLIRPPTSPQHTKIWLPVTSPRVSSARASTGSFAKVTQSQKEVYRGFRPEPTLRYHHLSATKIQAALRGYLARRNFRALRGLVRLQGVVRSQNVKRQTINAMKQMQLLVRVQTQIQSRRIQMLETRQNNKEIDNKCTLNQLCEDEDNGNWDDSVLTKEEIEARLRKKVEAVMKRERAMAYAYSHQLWKANPTLAQSPVDIQCNGFPWWWNWLEQQLPPATKNVTLTPPMPVSDNKPSPRPTTRAKQFQIPTRTTPNDPKLMKATDDVPLKDDDSLTSCPPFSVPNYMNPTVSAKAKVRATSNPKERIPGSPGKDSKRRFPFPLTPNIGSFKWNKGSNKGNAATQKVLEKHRSGYSIGDFISIDSTLSMPAMGGRKRFNRFA